MLRVSCDVHRWMTAFVGVVNHPYFATSGVAGTYTIENVPPGTYTIQAWHEQYGVVTQKVAVTTVPPVLSTSRTTCRADSGVGVISLSPRGLLVRASGTEDPFHRVVVPLVTGVLDRSCPESASGESDRPRFGPRRGIVQRDFVFEGVGGDAGEPFDDAEVLGGSHEAAFR